MRDNSLGTYLIVAFILMGSSSLGQPAEPREPSNQNKEVAQPDEPSTDSLKGPATSKTIVPSGSETCTGRQIEHSDGIFPEWLAKLFNDLKITDIIVAFFTFILALYTARLWKSTDKLWKSGEKALETTERAFVFIDGFDYELTTALDSLVGTEQMPEVYRRPETRGLFITRFACRPKWKNSGSTPTKNMRIRVHWGPSVEGVVQRYDSPPFTTSERRFFVGPQAIKSSSYIDMSAAPRALIDWSFHPVPPEPVVLIWGRADYEDFFGKSHFVEWCYQLRLSRPIGEERMTASFVQWGEHNRTDDG